MNNDLIKRAIQEFYTEEQWLVILLKDQWHSEQYSHLTRDRLKLNDLMTIEITTYNSFTPTAIHQVYIQTKHPRSIRPISVSCSIDTEQDYTTHIRKEVHTLIKTARLELFQLYRGLDLDYSIFAR